MSVYVSVCVYFRFFIAPKRRWRCCWPLRLSLLLLFLLLLMLPGVHELSLARNEKFDFYSQRKCAQSFIRFVLSGCLKPWDSTRRGFINLSGQWKCRKRCRCPVWERGKSLSAVFGHFSEINLKQKDFISKQRQCQYLNCYDFHFQLRFYCFFVAHTKWGR